MNRLIVATVLAALSVGPTACSDAESAQPRAKSSTAASSPSSSSSSSEPVPEEPELPGPGDTVTDFNGRPVKGMRYTVPPGVLEVDDGPGKRAYDLQDGGGSLSIGELKHIYAGSRSGLLSATRVGSDPGSVVKVLSRRKDLVVVAQGSVPVGGREVPLLAIRLADGATAQGDLWCFTGDTSCYKLIEDTTAQVVLIPWQDSMIWVFFEWSGEGSPPEVLLRARSDLLGSLRLRG